MVLQGRDLRPEGRGHVNPPLRKMLPRPGAVPPADKFGYSSLSFTPARIRAMPAFKTLDDLDLSGKRVLVRADLGLDTADRIGDALAEGRHDKAISPAEVSAVVAAEVEKVLAPVAQPLVIDAAHKPFVILVAGVNGSGKTTTIGKLAAKLRAEGRTVMLAAGDTFRAAAIDQLKIWAERSGASFIAREAGADAAGLVFEAVEAAKQKNIDVLLIDTAGRLQNRTELMGELEKVVRVMKKVEPAAPHAVLLVLDATTGQNGLRQAKAFSEAIDVSGLVLTKLDGTAKGGIVIQVQRELGVPVKIVGLGEGPDDLAYFDPGVFVDAILG